MAGINVSMGVSGVNEFKQSMAQAQQSVKTLDAALKLNEKQYKASGDAETYMQKKAQLLKQQLDQQKTAAKAAQDALQKMATQGVDKTSAAYQKMERQMYEAQGRLVDMENELKNLGSAEETATGTTDKMTDALNSIGKKVNLDAVIGGVDRITQGMESAARKIKDISTQIWNTMTEAASWADNQLTLSTIYGIDVETLQRMQQVADFIDTPVEAIIKAKKKLEQNMMYGGKDVMDGFTLLGVPIGTNLGKEGQAQDLRDWEDVFWETGEALKNMTNEVERDALAQQLLGKSWDELKPLFNAGREAYEKALSEQDVVTEDNVNKLGELDDKLQDLQNKFEILKYTVLADLAPSFGVLADGVSNLIKQLNDYLATDEGKEKMEALGQAIENLFTGIGDIDFSTAIDTVSKAITGLTDGLKWLGEHSGEAVTGLEIIVAGWAGLKLTGGALKVLQLINGIKGLRGGGAQQILNEFGGGAENGTAANQAANAAAGGGWLVGLQNWATQAGANIASFIGGIGSQALGAITDYAMYQTDIGRWAMGNETWQDVENAWNEKIEDIKKNAESFGEDWANVFENVKTWAQGLLTPNGTETDLNPENRDMQEYLTALDAFGKGVQGLLENIDNPAFEALYNAMPQELSDKLEEYWNQLQDGLTTPLDLASNEEFIQTMDEYFAQLKAAGLEPEIPAIIDPDFLKLAEEMKQQEMHMPVYLDPVLPQLPTPFGGFPHANGLPWVPYDGYPAILHKGERVMTAQENRNYTTNSNLYIESMYMNNGTDVNGLAASIAAQNRRIQTGYGS